MYNALDNGGPAGLIYGYLFVWCGVILQALVMAEMASMYVLNVAMPPVFLHCLCFLCHETCRVWTSSRSSPLKFAFVGVVAMANLSSARYMLGRQAECGTRLALL